MKIAYGSDLHLELGITEPELENIRDADILVLAGDIFKGRCEKTGWPQILKYAEDCHQKLEIPVAAVCGNHELYGEEIQQYIRDCREISQAKEGIYFLENEALDIDGVRFLGCTLWSDFAMAEDMRQAKDTAREIIYDYRRIKLMDAGEGERDIIPDDTCRWNAESKQFLRNMLLKPYDGPTVVVTHFPPVPMSAPEFADSPLTPYFNNEWTAEIQSGALSPDIWIAGHTHFMDEKRVGRTRICSRQGGYPGELGPFSWGVVET